MLLDNWLLLGWACLSDRLWVCPADLWMICILYVAVFDWRIGLMHVVFAVLIAFGQNWHRIEYMVDDLNMIMALIIYYRPQRIVK